MKHQSMRQLFFISIGNFSKFPIEIKSPPGRRSALGWRGVTIDIFAFCKADD